MSAPQSHTPGELRFATTPSNGPVFHLHAGNRLIAHVELIEEGMSEAESTANLERIALALDECERLRAERDALRDAIQEALAWPVGVLAMLGLGLLILLAGLVVSIAPFYIADLLGLL